MTHSRLSIFLLLCILPACAVSTPPRLPDYLGTALPSSQSASLPSSNIEAGLIVVNDTTAPQSSPALSENGLAFLRDQVIRRVEAALPIKITKVIPVPAGMVPSSDPEPWVRLAREQGVPYLLLAVFSSAESEIPVYLPLDGAPEQGGTRPQVSGFEANNYAIAELALLDVQTGQVLATADGNAWSKLNRLYAPVKSNSYPVIHRSLRIAPIYPTEENAKDVLRGIAADEALEQAVLDLQRQWKTRS